MHKIRGLGHWRGDQFHTSAYRQSNGLHINLYTECLEIWSKLKVTRRSSCSVYTLKASSFLEKGLVLFASFRLFVAAS